MIQSLGSLMTWVISLEHLHLFLFLVFLVSILVSEKTPESMMAWIFTITVFPFGGIVLYLLFGVNWRKRRVISSQETVKDKKKSRNFLEYDTSQAFHSEKLKAGNPSEILEKSGIENKERKISEMLYKTEGTYLTANSSYEFFYDGKEAFDSIISDIRKAKKSIYMEYFIWRSDELGEKIKDELLKKAKEGLKIKLLFDGMGSLGTISGKYKKELEDAGVEFKYFLDVKFSLSKMNYRNHRKMTIIDNRILHSGGMNLGIEYITGGERFESWRDSNFRVEGELTVHYLAIFITDWLNSKGKMDFDMEDIDKTIKENEKNRDNISGSYLMQVSSSGPDTVWTSLKNLYSQMITSADEEVLVQSPYFVPDMSLISQMKIAALSGVKIKLMIAGVPDQKTPYWIAETHFRELLSAGVEIYRYNAGFIHCKNIITDGKISTMGTCNFDMRSFEINYEVNTVFYNEEISQNMRRQFYEDIEKCETVTLENIQKSGFLGKLRNSALKVLSPIM